VSLSRWGLGLGGVLVRRPPCPGKGFDGTETMSKKSSQAYAPTPIWFGKPDLDALTEMTAGTLASHLGIEYTEIGPDFLRGTMPVDERTMQPRGIMHGGASAAFAETLGSVAAHLCVNRSRKRCLGLDISVNHIQRAFAPGKVTGTARPLHIGRTTHVWEIRIENAAGALVGVSRLTIIVFTLPERRS